MLVNFNDILLANILIISKLGKRAVLVHCKTKVLATKSFLAVYMLAVFSEPIHLVGRSYEAVQVELMN